MHNRLEDAVGEYKPLIEERTESIWGVNVKEYCHYIEDKYQYYKQQIQEDNSRN